MFEPLQYLNSVEETESHDQFEAIQYMNIVEAASAQSIDQVSEKYDGWERISLKVDSGAIDTVFPKQAAASVPIQETERSKWGAVSSSKRYPN